MNPATRSPSSDSRHVLLARRILLALLGLLGGLSLIMLSALLLIALQLNRDARSHSEHLVNNLWETTRQRLITNTRDNAYWGDAYRHLHLQIDSDWAWARDNLGPSLFNNFRFEGVFVVDARDQTRYAMDRGSMTEVQLQDWLGSFPASLIEEARLAEDDEHVATRILHSQGQPVFLGAARLSPGNDPGVQRNPGVQSVLVLAYRLAPEKLLNLGASYEIAQLRVPSSRQDASQSPQLQIDPHLLLRWDPEQPGNRLLRVLLPILLSLLVVLFLVVLGISRRALNTARLLDRQYTQISASRTALANSEARFRNVAEAASDWFWETDLQLCIGYLSERFAEVTGHPAQVWLGRRLDEMLHCQEQPLGEWIRRQTAASPRAVVRCTHYAADGRLTTSHIAVRPILQDDLVIGYQGSATDISQEVAVEQRLLHLSRHDALTGLANRNQLREFIEAQLAQLPYHGEPLSLLNLDLDHFKPVNDLYGHGGGDRVLCEVARRMTHCLPEGALLARQGGDEFILVAPGLGERHALEQLCLTLIGSVSQPCVIGDQEVLVGLSIGIACAPEHSCQADELLRFSDLALYQAKNAGRSTWRRYDPAMSRRIEHKRELENNLRQALRDDQFSLRYQPRHDVRSGRICGAEALIRWEHAQRGLCMPDQFISLAEENGLIVPISDWVLRQACTDALLWEDDLRVSVNISAVEFRVPGLVERVSAVLAATGLPARRLELELTERVVIDDAASSLELMNALKALGVRLSMDDFGTGYSSLSYLKDFPFDNLKIDRSFINEIEHSPQGRSIVQAIIDLGRALSLKVTAEGVETEQQLQRLALFTCDEAQGYYLNRPMPLDALLEAIARHNPPQAL